jgi:decaprenyl-diphosphate synthase subunit 1
MIAEMIHSASLIHDDVVDQADFRRGKPSVNVLWNHKKVGAVCMHYHSVRRLMRV